MSGMADHSFTCITCQVRFPDSDMHRVHFKSDWHRYNLKRKVAGLTVVTVTVFESKKLAHDQQAKEGEKEAQKSSTYCIACCKNFKSVKAYENHIPSKKHQEMILKFDSKPPAKMAKMETEEDEEVEGGDMEEVDSDEWEEDEPIPTTECLFCSRTSASLERSLHHMTTEHSFFLPDPEFLTDLEGLVEYLGAKVGQGHMCLWCNEKGKRFETKDDVQRHMVGKGHCKLLHEGEALLEYDEWYDYSPSYPEGQQKVDKDEEVELEALDDSGFQLVLPSGATIGHRSLLRYYRQSLNPARAVVLARSPHGMASSGRQLLPTYKALGWTGCSGPEARRKAKDLGHMRRLKNYHWERLGTRGNKLSTNKHFKDRNGMC